MDIVPVFERLGEELSTAKEENITEEEYSPLVAEEGSSSTEIDLSTVATPDTYQLNLSIVVTETDSEEIESEFCDALTEIHGEKSFPCTLCDKLCKSKGGLTRHKFQAQHCGSTRFFLLYGHTSVDDRKN